MIEFGTDNNEANHLAPFLISAEEGEENEIKYVVALAARGEKGTGADHLGIPALEEIVKNCYPIYVSEEKIYEILFDKYIIHQTRNESLTCWDDYEEKHGNYFIIFEKSRLLDYLNIAIEKEIAKAYWPQGWKHYGIYCQNHIIDIVAPEPPTIRKLPAHHRGSSQSTK